MSKTVYLSGIGKWMHKLFIVDEYEGNKSWNMTLYPDKESLAVIKSLKLMNHTRVDDDGVHFSFRRPVAKKWKLKAGENPEFEAPVVKDAVGQLWPEEKIIGNGSKVTLKLDVYPVQGGKNAARLESVRVDSWVEYIDPEAPVDNQQVPDPEKMNDFIPF